MGLMGTGRVPFVGPQAPRLPQQQPQQPQYGPPGGGGNGGGGYMDGAVSSNRAAQAGASMPPVGSGLMGTGPMNQTVQGGLGQSVSGAHQQLISGPDAGGVVAGRPPTMNAVQSYRQSGPTQEELQAEAQRKQAGAAMATSNPNNAALAGYMMG